MKLENRCNYPGCTSFGDVGWDLLVTNENNARVQMPFCWYHRSVMMGGHFTVVKIETDKKPFYDFKIEGPFREVEITEQVIAAREIVAQRNENNKKKQKQ